MADNSTLPVASGTEVFANDDVSGVKYPRAKITWGADGTANDTDVASGKPLPIQLRASDGTPIADNTGIFFSNTMIASALDCSTTVTRPTNTTAYSVGSAVANSTSAPTVGGFTLASAASTSGGGGIITDAVIVSSNSSGTPLAGEIWIFDRAVAALNDAAPFTLSDSDAIFCLGKIPFGLAVDAGSNAIAHVTGLNMGFHCVGSNSLRFLIKALNAYVPASAETITVRIKGIRT